MNWEEKEHFNRLVEETRTTWWGRLTPSGRLRDRKKMELLDELFHPRPDQSILEVGCGAGEFTEHLAERGLSVTAFDLSLSALRQTRRRMPSPRGARLAAADLNSIPFREGSFDICLGFSILHHVDVERCFSEIIRVCRDGARFFFTEPNMLNPWIMVEKNIPWVKRKLEGTPEETAFFRWRLKKVLNSFPGISVEVKNIDFIHPLLPAGLLPGAEKLSDLFEKIPLIKEISGSLAIYGTVSKR